MEFVFFFFLTCPSSFFDQYGQDSVALYQLKTGGYSIIIWQVFPPPPPTSAAYPYHAFSRKIRCGGSPRSGSPAGLS
jgi:hypothetical protein